MKASSVVPLTIDQKLVIDAPTTFNAIPEQFVETLFGATPNVANLIFFVSHAVATNLTNMLGGQNGQMVTILGNGNTTVIHDVAKICTNTGANKVLLANIVYRFTYFNGVWYEDE